MRTSAPVVRDISRRFVLRNSKLGQIGWENLRVQAISVIRAIDFVRLFVPTRRSVPSILFDLSHVTVATFHCRFSVRKRRGNPRWCSCAAKRNCPRNCRRRAKVPPMPLGNAREGRTRDEPSVRRPADATTPEPGGDARRTGVRPCLNNHPRTRPFAGFARPRLRYCSPRRAPHPPSLRAWRIP